jgi:hypothetical protein
VITVVSADGLKVECETVVIVPEKALTEAGFIRAFTMKAHAHAKHEYQTLAQMAYFQYQDEELEVRELAGAIEIVTAQETIALEKGVVIFRLPGGDFNVWATGFINKKKMLETANRYCTRWVRLDI